MNGEGFRSASFCSGGQCVQVAPLGDGAQVRDSKRPDLEPLTFTAEEWREFLRGVRANEFDL
jgi:uncharacterized protein DUF397